MPNDEEQHLDMLHKKKKKKTLHNAKLPLHNHKQIFTTVSSYENLQGGQTCGFTITFNYMLKNRESQIDRIQGLAGTQKDWVFQQL